MSRHGIKCVVCWNDTFIFQLLWIELVLFKIRIFEMVFLILQLKYGGMNLDVTSDENIRTT